MTYYNMLMTHYGTLQHATVQHSAIRATLQLYNTGQHSPILKTTLTQCNTQITLQYYKLEYSTAHASISTGGIRDDHQNAGN